VKHVSRRTGKKVSHGHKLAYAIQRALQSLIGNLGFVVLGLAILGFISATGLASYRMVPAGASGIGTSATPTRTQPVVTKPTCGSRGLPACPQQIVWIPIKSHAPADLIAAARKSPLFNVDRSGNGDYLKNISLLGTPVYVQAIQKMAGVTFPDFYVLPVLDHSGAAVGAAELELNPSQTAIHVIAIMTYTSPHPGGAIPRLSAQSAIAAVATQRHTAMRVGSTPQLAYFPVNATAQQIGKIVWVAGGEFPADPIWLIAGANGQQYVVGVDGHAYAVSELPTSSS
jgi:hypothetical protein